MKEDEIRKLLERYYDGLTTQAEEQELKRFFTRTDTPQGLEAEARWFRQLEATRTAPEPDLPAGFSERLDSLIDQWNRAERPAEPVRPTIGIRRLRWVAGIAAGLLLAVGFGLGWHGASVPADTCATPEEAYAQAQRALTLLSETLNRGTQGMETLHLATHKVQTNLNKHLTE